MIGSNYLHSDCYPCETGLLHREHTSSLNDEWELGDVYDEVEDKNVGYDTGIFIEDREVVAVRCTTSQDTEEFLQECTYCH